MGSQKEFRVALKYKTTNVPGLPHERAQRVANDFASSIIFRSFSYAQDFIHLPSDFDCPEPKSIWILCDFNVHTPISEVKDIPLQCFKVVYVPGQVVYVSSLNTIQRLI